KTGPGKDPLRQIAPRNERRCERGRKKQRSQYDTDAAERLRPPSNDPGRFLHFVHSATSSEAALTDQKYRPCALIERARRHRRGPMSRMLVSTLAYDVSPLVTIYGIQKVRSFSDFLIERLGRKVGPSPAGPVWLLCARAGAGT